MANDYIPRPHARFHAWQNNFVTYVNGHLADLGLAAGAMGGTDKRLRRAAIAERASLESGDSCDTTKNELVRVERRQPLARRTRTRIAREAHGVIRTPGVGRSLSVPPLGLSGAPDAFVIPQSAFDLSPAT